MMDRRVIPVCGALAGAALSLAAFASDVQSWSAPKNDAVIRRTDSCNCGELLPGTGAPGQGQGLPDVIGVTLSAWQPNAPADDLFTGCVVDHDSPYSNFFRMELTFAGLVNPPGTLGVGAGTTFGPFTFGNNPVFGFVELDVDDDKDTGGESPSVAALRYLGNAARFGARPHGSMGARAAMTGDDLNLPWDSTPQVCRSGADWVLSFCGCFPVTVVYKNSLWDSTFGSGDTWIVQGRFFQRTGGYQQASAMFGGSQPGLYDPPVKLRFAHNAATNETKVTLVYPLTQTGAAQMNAQAAQPIDLSASNHTSIAEGVQDLITRAQNLAGLSGLPRELVRQWADKSFSQDVQDPTRWEVHALVGTTYSTPCDGLYVWTDIGFDTRTGDVDGDGLISMVDRQIVQNFLTSYDGDAERDADGTVNGHITVANLGVSFHLYDMDGDGIIGPLDVAFFTTFIPPCIADFNQSGSASVDDLFLYLNAWFSSQPAANVSGSGVVSIDDLFLFLSVWFVGCP